MDTDGQIQNMQSLNISPGVQSTSCKNPHFFLLFSLCERLVIMIIMTMMMMVMIMIILMVVMIIVIVIVFQL